MIRLTKTYMLASVGLPALLCGVSAEAQDAPAPNEVQDIVVTAQRTSESLQKVPIAVSAISSDQLVARGLTNTASLEGAIPSLTMNKIGTATVAYLRGVGSNATDPANEPSVATYVDGVYNPSPISNLFAFNNIERVEVLKGPQGTLFGRNATGGVIQIVTRDPNQALGMEASLEYGNYKTVSASAYLTGGIAPWLAADLAVTYTNRGDGFGRNLFTGAETFKKRDLALRSKWLLTPSDATRITIALSYSQFNGSSLDFQQTPETRAVSGIPDPGRFNVNSDVASVVKSMRYGASLKIEQDLGFAQFVSTTAYNKLKEPYFWLDTDTSPAPVILPNAKEGFWNYSQEFQLIGKSGRLKWQVGAFLFKLKPNFDLFLGGFVAAPFDHINIIGRPITNSVAGYGQATYDLTDDLHITAGLRYTHDRLRMSGETDGPTGTPLFVAVPQRTSTSKPTWRLALDYNVIPDVLGYVSYNRGIKSGGFNSSAPADPAFRPEILDAYEVGLKTMLFDRRLRFNIAAFYYDYKDLQVTVQNTSGTGNAAQNAAKARITGIDGDFEALLFPNFTLSGGFSFLNSKYREYRNPVVYHPSGAQILPAPDVTGNDLVNAPKFTGNVSAAYRIPTSSGDFNIRGTVLRKAVSYATPDNAETFPAYTLVNGVVGWTSPDEHLGVQFWINNAFDKRYYITRIQTFFGWLQTDADPRTYGVRVNLKF